MLIYYSSKGLKIMAQKDKKFVEEITAMDEDFAKWYTDIVKKADLIDYSSVKGCMIIRPYGYAVSLVSFLTHLKRFALMAAAAHLKS